MAVNQPKITDDQVDNSWMLEVTNQLNSEEARINALLSRIEQLESAARTSSGPSVTYAFTNGLNGSFEVTPSDTGVPQTVTTGTGSRNLQLTNYVQLVQASQLEYTFTGPGVLSTVPHQVFIGGQKLIESVDYTPSDSVPGRITLTSQPDLTGNPVNQMEQLMIELSIWSL